MRAIWMFLMRTGKSHLHVVRSIKGRDMIVVACTQRYVSPSDFGWQPHEMLIDPRCEACQRLEKRKK